jgi:2'-phosphotransferase
VRDCPKKRFEIQKFDHGGLDTEFIRASQGHTIKLDDDKLLKLLTADELPSVVIHGTYSKSIGAIKGSGLSKMQRNHIHMARDIPGKGSVISGMRTSCDTIIEINVAKCMAAGIKFYEASNGVILSPGNDRGAIPPTFLAYRSR